MFNLAHVHEALASVIPDRECLVFRDRRFSWSQVTERTRRLASVLRAHGLGCHTPRSAPGAVPYRPLGPVATVKVCKGEGWTTGSPDMKSSKVWCR